MRGAVALIAVVSWSATLGCRGHARPSLEAEPLPLTSLALDFTKNDEGHLVFQLDLPKGKNAVVDEVTWELWLGSLRFATGIEKGVVPTASPDGSWRITVNTPLVYRHMTWVEGTVHVDAGLVAEVHLGAPAVRVERFRGRREVLVHGRPTLDELE